MKGAPLGLLVSLTMLQVVASIPAQMDRFVGTGRGGWGYIDKFGNVVVQPRFEWAGRFADGLARVEVGNKWGYIHMAGKSACATR